MKLTADTITEEQIYELMCWLVVYGPTKERGPEEMSDLEACGIATSTRDASNVVARARARCAEILNARAELKE